MKASWIGLALCAPGVALAGGWTQPEDHYYAKAWVRVLRGGKGAGAGGDTFDLRDAKGDPLAFTDVAANVYAEHGLKDGTTLLLSVTPFGHATVGDESATYVGPLGLGARQRLLVAGPVNLAVEARYAFSPPVGDESLAEGVDPEGGTWFYAPTVEDHRADAELQIGVGLPADLWLTLNGGGRIRSADGTDPVVTVSGQLGWSGPWGLVPEIHGGLYRPLGDVDEPANVAGVGQTRYIALGLGLSWWFLESWAIHAGIDGAMNYAANASAAPMLFGVEHRGVAP